MRKIIISLLFMYGCLMGQSSSDIKYRFQISVKSDPSLKSVYNFEKGLSGGFKISFKSKNGHLVNISNKYTDYDLDVVQHSDNKSNTREISNTKTDTLPNKSFYIKDLKDEYDIMCNFSFYPDLNIIPEYLPRIKETGCFFIGIVYKKIKTCKDSILYSASYFSPKVSDVPLNKKFTWEIFQDYFPKDEIDLLLFYDNPIKKSILEPGSLQDVIFEDESNFFIDSLFQKANSSEIGMSKLKIGSEFVRIGKGNNELLIRRHEYPMTSGNTVYLNNEFIDLKTYIYKMSFVLPMEIYNKQKMDLFNKQDKERKLNFNYSIYVIPMKKNGEKYLFQIYGVIKYSSGVSVRMDKITLKPGEKYRLSIDYLVGLSNNTVGEKLVINTKDDIYKYAEDYIVISF